MKTSSCGLEAFTRARAAASTLLPLLPHAAAVVDHDAHRDRHILPPEDLRSAARRRPRKPGRRFGEVGDQLAVPVQNRGVQHHQAGIRAKNGGPSFWAQPARPSRSKARLSRESRSLNHLSKTAGNQLSGAGRWVRDTRLPEMGARLSPRAGLQTRPPSSWALDHGSSSGRATTRLSPDSTRCNGGVARIPLRFPTMRSKYSGYLKESRQRVRPQPPPAVVPSPGRARGCPFPC